MYYSIGEVSNKTGIPIPTLRYYDKEGLFPTIGRSNGGIRIFTDLEIGTIKMIECLKSTGLSIKEIKQYIDWHEEGDATLQKRRDMFYERLEVVKEQQKAIEKTMDMVKFKCWYYDTALASGSEESIKNQPPDDLPVEIQELAKAFLD